MKQMKKFFALFTMMFACFSFKGVNGANKIFVAEAAASGSSATLSSEWKTKNSMLQSANHLLITNDASKIPTSYWVGPIDVDTDANTIIKAYIGPNAKNSNKLDCVIYADVETIYAQNGSFLFASLTNVESITFDCKFSMAHAADKSMLYMFADNTHLAQIEGLTNLDTTNVTNMSFMFYNCQQLKSLDVSSFKTTSVTTMQSMFDYCLSLTTIEGLEKWNTHYVTDMSRMFYECICLTTLDLSSFVLVSITDDDKLNDFVGNAVNLKEIKAPSYLNGHTIQLPNTFGIGVLDASTQGMTIIPGSKELNNLFTTLRNLYTCQDYMQGPQLQATYNSLSNEDKEIFSTLKDYDGVLLTDKLAYMCYLAESHTVSATAETYMSISPVASQYLVIIIACLSLALIGGYYLVQKKKYAK